MQTQTDNKTSIKTYRILPEAELQKHYAAFRWKIFQIGINQESIKTLSISEKGEIAYQFKPLFPLLAPQTKAAAQTMAGQILASLSEKLQKLRAPADRKSLQPVELPSDFPDMFAAQHLVLDTLNLMYSENNIYPYAGKEIAAWEAVYYLRFHALDYTEDAIPKYELNGQLSGKYLRMVFVNNVIVELHTNYSPVYPVEEADLRSLKLPVGAVIDSKFRAFYEINGNRLLPVTNTIETKVALCEGEIPLVDNKIYWIREEEDETLTKIKSFLDAQIEDIQGIDGLKKLLKQSNEQNRGQVAKKKNSITCFFSVGSVFEDTKGNIKNFGDLGGTYPYSLLNASLWGENHLSKTSNSIKFTVLCKFNGINNIDSISNKSELTTDVEKLNPGISFQTIIHELGHAMMWKYFYLYHEMEFIINGKKYNGTIEQILNNFPKTGYIDIMEQMRLICATYNNDNKKYPYNDDGELKEGDYDVQRTDDYSIWFPKHKFNGKISLANYFCYKLAEKLSPEKTIWITEGMGYNALPKATIKDLTTSPYILSKSLALFPDEKYDDLAVFWRDPDKNAIFVQRRELLLTKSSSYPTK